MTWKILWNKICKVYLEGIYWVYSYYYFGCPSWEWYYPYFYAPLAIDLLHNSNLECSFTLGKPYKPIEQLMSVLPKQSCKLLPAWLTTLLWSGKSKIIDFYPLKFENDIKIS